MRTLPGLTSRWITPRRWAKSRAAATSAPIAAARPGSSGPCLQNLRERPAVDVLHDDEIRPLALTPVEDRHDVGMGEIGGRSGFPPEALDEGPVGRQFREQNLERHRTVEEEIPGQVHLGHAAPRDMPDHLVAVAEDLLLGGHLTVSLGGRGVGHQSVLARRPAENSPDRAGKRRRLLGWGCGLGCKFGSACGSPGRLDHRWRCSCHHQGCQTQRGWLGTQGRAASKPAAPAPGSTLAPGSKLVPINPKVTASYPGC